MRRRGTRRRSRRTGSHQPTQTCLWNTVHLSPWSFLPRPLTGHFVVFCFLVLFEFSTCGAASWPFFLFPFLLLAPLSCCTWNDFAWHVRRLLVPTPVAWLWYLRQSIAYWGRKGDSYHVASPLHIAGAGLRNTLHWCIIYQKECEQRR